MNKSHTSDSRAVIDCDSRGTAGSGHLWGAAAHHQSVSCEIIGADEALQTPGEARLDWSASLKG